ncbi:MAG: hypothetical protein KBONHNOK_00961 [Candidatus Methanoperedenaceae archaeon GB50]|nr:MAG: hypothetical protein KBONHNOK_00961 [Candidatus Methanoperedenaceae archaeon GB50]
MTVLALIIRIIDIVLFCRMVHIGFLFEDDAAVLPVGVVTCDLWRNLKTRTVERIHHIEVIRILDIMALSTPEAVCTDQSVVDAVPLELLDSACRFDGVITLAVAENAHLLPVIPVITPQLPRALIVAVCGRRWYQ